MKNPFRRERKDLAVEARTLPMPSDTRDLYPTYEVTAEIKRKVYVREPMIFSGINKKAADIVREGWHVERIDGEDIEENLDEAIDDFNRRSQIEAKISQAVICAYVYGDGYLEIIYDESENIGPEKEPPRNAMPFALRVLDPETITKISYAKSKKMFSQSDKVKEIQISGERMIHVKIHSLPFSEFGISVIEVAANVLRSKMNADLQEGEILDRFGSGFLDVSINGMTPTERDAVNELLKADVAPKHFVHDDSYKISVINPTTIAPAEFNDYFYTNIANALEMPVAVLTGIRTGDIKGSESEKRQYLQNIANVQVTIIGPILERIYKKIADSAGVEWAHEVVFTPLYVDESSEAEILGKRMKAVRDGIESMVISEDEARRIIEEGVVELDHEAAAAAPMEKPEPEEEPKEEELELKPEIIAEIEEARASIEEAKISEISFSLQSDVDKLQQYLKERELGKKIIDEGGAAVDGGSED